MLISYYRIGQKLVLNLSNFQQGTLILNDIIFDFSGETYFVIPRQDALNEIIINSCTYKLEERIPTDDVIDYVVEYINNEALSIVRSDMFHLQKIRQIKVLDTTLKEIGDNHVTNSILSLWKQHTKIDESHIQHITQQQKQDEFIPKSIAE